FTATLDRDGLHSFPTRRSSDLVTGEGVRVQCPELPEVHRLVQEPFVECFLQAVFQLPVVEVQDRIDLVDLSSLLRKFSVAFLQLDRKSTRLNSSHVKISYAVFC